VFAPYVIFGLAVLGFLGCSTSSPPVSLVKSSSIPLQRQIPLALPHSLGILPFDYHSDVSRWAWLRQGLPDMLVTDLAMQSKIHIISRQSLGEVLREQWLQHRGMMDSGLAVKLGKLSGVRYLLKGSVYHLDTHLSVDVHLLDVERGIVVRTGRVTGSPETFTALERQLAQQVGTFFGTPPDSIIDRDSGEDVPLTMKSSPNGEIEEMSQVFQPDVFFENPQSPLLSIEIPLSLDRAQRLREEAWLFADEVWRRGLVIELGALYDQVNGGPLGSQDLTEEYLTIPVTASFLPEKLHVIHRVLTLSPVSQNGLAVAQGMLAWKAEESTARLFAERVRSPRRLFVRAISQSGEVLAVSSLGSWRVDHKIDVKDSGAIQILLSPEPTIEGNAGFSKSILSQYPHLQHFDAVVVPVPEERRMVSVEILESANETALHDSVFEGLHVTLQQRLKSWLWENWLPPITESLPVRGYLPGNRRVIQLRVSGHHGIVDDVRVTQVPHEALLQADIKRLVSQLIGYCLSDCRRISREQVEEGKAFTFRVQLDLLKDLQHIGFGKVSSTIGK